MKKLKIKHYQYLLIALLIITVIVGIGSFIYGKTYEYNFINSKLKDSSIQLIGLKLNTDNKFDNVLFTCYPYRGDGNCSNQIIENYQKLDNFHVNACNEQLKNNVQIVRPIIQSRPTVTNTNCYTDIMGLHCNSFGF